VEVVYATISNINQSYFFTGLSSNYFENFSPNASFEKWALVEAIDLETIPPSFKQFILPSGLYAVFHYKGLNTDSSIFQYIYSEWLPSSGYILDNRPHFEVLGNLYRNNHPESEEDIWIPIKPMN
jgi:AraC family transcriptional regulator